MNNPDLDWALTMYSTFARGGDDEQLRYLEVPGEPWSKARPRFARRGNHVTTYQPNDDRHAEAQLRTRFAAWIGQPFPGNVMLACRFYRGNSQRIDTDNLLKHVSDSGNGVLWADDSQVTLVFGEILLDADRPRTVVVTGNHLSTLLRGDDRQKPCAHCGELYLPLPGSRSQRFCSRACAYVSRTVVLTPIPCAQCGHAFKPRTKTQKFCSPTCRAADLADRNKRPHRPFSRCATCDKELAHHRGGRCRDCWRVAPGTYPGDDGGLDALGTPGAVIRVRAL